MRPVLTYVAACEARSTVQLIWDGQPINQLEMDAETALRLIAAMQEAVLQIAEPENKQPC